MSIFFFSKSPYYLPVGLMLKTIVLKYVNIYKILVLIFYRAFLGDEISYLFAAIIVR